VIGAGLVVNDWCAFTGFDTTAMEISVIEATFSQSTSFTPFFHIKCSLLIPPLRTPGTRSSRRYWWYARVSCRQLGLELVSVIYYSYGYYSVDIPKSLYSSTTLPTSCNAHCTLFFGHFVPLPRVQARLSSIRCLSVDRGIQKVTVGAGLFSVPKYPWATCNSPDFLRSLNQKGSRGIDVF